MRAATRTASSPRVAGSTCAMNALHESGGSPRPERMIPADRDSSDVGAAPTIAGMLAKYLTPRVTRLAEISTVSTGLSG